MRGFFNSGNKVKVIKASKKEEREIAKKRESFKKELDLHRANIAKLREEIDFLELKKKTLLKGVSEEQEKAIRQINKEKQTVSVLEAKVNEREIGLIALEKEFHADRKAKENLLAKEQERLSRLSGSIQKQTTDLDSLQSFLSQKETALSQKRASLKVISEEILLKEEALTKKKESIDKLQKTFETEQGILRKEQEELSYQEKEFSERRASLSNEIALLKAESERLISERKKNEAVIRDLEQKTKGLAGAKQDIVLGQKGIDDKEKSLYEKEQFLKTKEVLLIKKERQVKAEIKMLKELRR